MQASVVAKVKLITLYDEDLRLLSLWRNSVFM
jgi:hypothetical protein